MAPTAKHNMLRVELEVHDAFHRVKASSINHQYVIIVLDIKNAICLVYLQVLFPLWSGEN